jgi:hypothetical protein
MLDAGSSDETSCTIERHAPGTFPIDQILNHQNCYYQLTARIPRNTSRIGSATARRARKHLCALRDLDRRGGEHAPGRPGTDPAGVVRPHAQAGGDADAERCGSLVVTPERVIALAE